MWSVEVWKAIFDWVAVVLVGLTFFVGAGALVTGSILNDRQAEQIRTLDKNLTDAKTDLEKQRERTAGLEADAANAKSEMAKQQTRAANAEKALLELQQRFAHRQIDKPTHDRLVAALHPFGGSEVLVIKFGDAEASTYADDLIAVLRDAHWNVRLDIFGAMSPTPYGLICKIDESAPAGRALAEALRALPTAKIEPTTMGTSLVANIIVGLRQPA